MIGVLAFVLALTGEAQVIDGDTLRVQGETVRLYGIDAPEKAQRCTDGEGKRYLCGIRALLDLKRIVQDKLVTCEAKGGQRDRYRRLIAVCSMRREPQGERIDLNAYLVRQGLALAYRTYAQDYTDEERATEHERLGLWAGAFQPPWEWREERRGKRQ